jgi:predicted nuclease of predicted toxin-antitoxin system
MRLLADESVDRQIVERLRADGHDVSYVAELEPGITDTEVLQRANDSSALLLTSDKDFGDLVFKDNLGTFFGVVLIRLSGLSSELKAETVSNAFHQHADDFVARFGVISSNRIRIQPKP